MSRHANSSTTDQSTTSLQPRRGRWAIGGVAAGLIGAGQALAGVNLLVNGSFELVGPNGPAVELTGLSLVGESAADDWYVFHNSVGTTKTELLPTTLPGGGSLMMRVATDGPSNGIEQVVYNFNEGPPCIKNGVWIYVVSGQVFIGAGNGGTTGSDAFTTTTGQWEFVQAQNSFCPANLTIIYSASIGGAEFYVDLAEWRALDCVGPTGDINQDGIVNGADLGILLAEWGTPCNGCAADLNNDLSVDGADLGILLFNWGC